MGKVIGLNKGGIKLLKIIIKDLKEHGKSWVCPNWDETMLSKFHVDDVNVITFKTKIVPMKQYRSNNPIMCGICMTLFPKGRNYESGYCPCKTDYKTDFLIKRLEEIIDYNKKRLKVKK